MLDHLRSTLDQNAIRIALNSKDTLNRAPLYYACASGQSESVQLLIKAGATVDTDTYSGSPWHGCVEFEAEARSADWSRYPKTYEQGKTEPDAGGVLIADRQRPMKYTSHVSREPSFPTTGLDGILRLLVAHALKSCDKLMDEAIVAAVQKNAPYTVDCLLRTRDATGTGTHDNFDRETIEYINGRKDAMLSPHQAVYIPIDKVLWNENYALLLEKIAEPNILEFHYGQTVLHQLVSAGFTSLLSQAASVREIKLEDPDWCYEETRAKNKCFDIYPLLLTACRREQPNMDVIRLLIEDKCVNVNSQVYVVPNYSNIPPSAGKGALHFLVLGNHWWQAAEALSYLVERGADIELKDEKGFTPLNTVLQAVRGPNFNRRAFKMLLNLGADVNSADVNGVTCLARAACNPEIYQLLLQHGAIVDRSALESAITKQDYSLLEMMLFNGADLNTRKVVKEKPAQPWSIYDAGRLDTLSKEEMYLLNYVASQAKSDKKEEKEFMEKVFHLLLRHGADPIARYETTTVLHRLINDCGNENTECLKHVLNLPNNNLEVCDSQGLTPLLLACRRRGQGENGGAVPSVVHMLLDHNVNIRARDHNNMNALHHLVYSRGLFGSNTDGDSDNISRMVHAAPDLVHEADNQGNTPLHYALYNLQSCVNALISAGSSVSARNESGSTPLHILFSRSWRITPDGVVDVERCELLERFVSMGADINAQDQVGNTPIFNFFYTGGTCTSVELPSMESMFGKGIPAKFRMEDELAVKKENLVLDLFERMGVNWHKANHAGETLLHVAASDMNSNKETGRRVKRFSFLMGKGLDPMQENKEYKTPLDLAAALGNEDVLDLFKKP